VFSKRANAYKMGKLQLPDLRGFMEEPPLPAAESEAQPLNGEEWIRMTAAEAALVDRELALVNRLLRSTGMRSAEVANLHRGWLVKEGAGWAIEIRDRKELDWSQKGVKNRKVPLSDELAAVLVEREGYLIAPGRSRTGREDLVNRDHNAFLKGIIGGLGEKTQGNHRLRDTVCSALWSLYGPATAQEAAGHVDPKTTSKHYAKRMATVPAAMAAEMAIWAPGNVIPLALRAAG
jgi:integrase